MADLVGGMEKTPKFEALPHEESSVEADEKALETLIETQGELPEEESKITELPARAAEGAQSAGPARAAGAARDAVQIEVEKILEKDLKLYYASLPADAKVKFKKKGEEAASEISKMVRSLKLEFKKALTLIRDWLLTIPGVNRFFLEQEAKLKVDLVQSLIETRKEDASKHP